MPVILEFFTGVANTTSTPIGVEGGGWWGVTQWWAKAMSTLKTAKWHPLVLFLAPLITQSS